MISTICLLVFVGLGIAYLVALSRARRVAGVEPRCAACGYIVQGLPSAICPECGVDLSRPDAVVHSGGLRPGRFIRVVAWSMFCMLAVALPLAAVWSLVPHDFPLVHIDSFSMTFSQPASQGYQSILVSADSNYWTLGGDPEPRPDQLTIELTGLDGKTRQLDLDPSNLHYRDDTAAMGAMSSSPLDAASLRSWLNAAGVKGDAKAMDAEASVVIAQIQQLDSSPPKNEILTRDGFSGAAGSYSHRVAPLPWADLIPVAVGLIIWGVGVLRILRKPSGTCTVNKSSPHII